MALEDVKQQAIYLARENRASDPSIRRIYWFPNEAEVRLVEVSEDLLSEFEDAIQPFYFRPSPQDNLPYPSGVALIAPGEERRAELPVEWGTWDNATELRDDRGEGE